MCGNSGPQNFPGSLSKIQTVLCAFQQDKNSTPQIFGRTSFPFIYHVLKIFAENRFNCLKHQRVSLFTIMLPTQTYLATEITWSLWEVEFLETGERAQQ